MHVYYVTSSNYNDKWLTTKDSHILQREITIIFKDENDNYYQIVLDAGFQCDGLSVPSIFRWYLPSWDNKNALYNLAGAIHDALYTLKGANMFTRSECDDIFRGLLRDAGISRSKAGMADWCVGKFAGGDEHWGNDEWDNADKIHVKLMTDI